ncbi:MAG: hypothetical protein U1E63_07145 [Burkholderiales bacterium]
MIRRPRRFAAQLEERQTMNTLERMRAESPGRWNGDIWLSLAAWQRVFNLPYTMSGALALKLLACEMVEFEVADPERYRCTDADRCLCAVLLEAWDTPDAEDWRRTSDLYRWIESTIVEKQLFKCAQVGGFELVADVLHDAMDTGSLQ